MAQRISREQVQDVARLARLRLDDEEVERLRDEMTTILEHLARIAQADVEGVEALAHPADCINRLADDEVGEAMDVQRLLDLAPAVEDRFLAVPKVLGGESA